MINYVDSICKIVEDIARNVDEYSHIDSNRVAIGTIKSRTDTEYGLWAHVMPVAKDGEEYSVVNAGRLRLFYETSKVYVNGVASLYLIELSVPRFLNLSYEDKLLTIFHELYHIGPKFDGDLRVFEGKNYLHGDSIEKYDERMRQFIKKYLNNTKNKGVLDILKQSEESLISAEFKTFKQFKSKLCKIMWT